MGKSKQPRRPNPGCPIKLKPGTILTDAGKAKWLLGKPIAAGGFGDIYLTAVARLGKIDRDTPYVAKVELKSSGPLFVEMNFYLRAVRPRMIKQWKHLKKLDHLGIPSCYGFGSITQQKVPFRFLILERFGVDLHTIFLINGRKFPLKTVATLGLQIMDIYEYIHYHGYIHADVKGSNLLLRLGENGGDYVYLLDYGLACSYVDRSGHHKEYVADIRRAHDGTLEYTSRDAHIGAHSRRGDMEVLGYNLIQWMAGSLPWECEVMDPETVSASKTYFMKNIPDFLATCFPNGNCPDFLLQYMNYVVDLEFTSKPDYNHLRSIFRKALKSAGLVDDGALNITIPTKMPVGKRGRGSDTENHKQCRPASRPDLRGRKPCGPVQVCDRRTRLKSLSEKYPEEEKEFDWVKVLQSHPERLAKPPVKDCEPVIIHREVEDVDRSFFREVENPRDNPTPAMLEVMRKRKRSLSPTSSCESLPLIEVSQVKRRRARSQSRTRWHVPLSNTSSLSDNALRKKFERRVERKQQKRTARAEVEGRRKKKETLEKKDVDKTVEKTVVNRVEKIEEKTVEIVMKPESLGPVSSRTRKKSDQELIPIVKPSRMTRASSRLQLNSAMSPSETHDKIDDISSTPTITKTTTEHTAAHEKNSAFALLRARKKTKKTSRPSNSNVVLSNRINQVQSVPSTQKKTTSVGPLTRSKILEQITPVTQEEDTSSSGESWKSFARTIDRKQISPSYRPPSPPRLRPSSVNSNIGFYEDVGSTTSASRSRSCSRSSSISRSIPSTFRRASPSLSSSSSTCSSSSEIYNILHSKKRYDCGPGASRSRAPRQQRHNNIRKRSSSCSSILKNDNNISDGSSSCLPIKRRMCTSGACGSRTHEQQIHNNNNDENNIRERSRSCSPMLATRKRRMPTKISMIKCRETRSRACRNRIPQQQIHNDNNNDDNISDCSSSSILVKRTEKPSKISTFERRETRSGVCESRTSKKQIHNDNNDNINKHPRSLSSILKKIKGGMPPKISMIKSSNTRSGACDSRTAQQQIDDNNDNSIIDRSSPCSPILVKRPRERLPNISMFKRRDGRSSACETRTKQQHNNNNNSMKKRMGGSPCKIPIYKQKKLRRYRKREVSPSEVDFIPRLRSGRDHSDDFIILSTPRPKSTPLGEISYFPPIGQVLPARRSQRFTQVIHEYR